MPASRCFDSSDSYNFTHFPVGTTNSIKNSTGCVIVIACHGGNPYLKKQKIYIAENI